MIEIEVPATSANLGPGFDCLGIALSLSNTFRIERAATTHLKGCPPQWAGEDNLFLRSFRHACSILQTSVPEIAVEFVSPIPPARGLGSSAALAVAGAAAALLLQTGAEGGTELACSDLLRRPENLDFLLRAATDVEGHPDNAAPAIYGGFAAAALAGQKIIVSRSALPEAWRFAACIPDFNLETSVARKALPSSYPRSDVVHSLSHAVLTALAIQKADLSLLSRACEDRIHEPYRRPLIPDFEIVETACRAQNAAAVWLSGSGPTILAVFEPSVPEKTEQSLASVIAARARYPWHIVPLHADNQGVLAHRISKEVSSV
jgi:homoserine kinase